MGVVSSSLVAASFGPARVADLTEPIIGYSWVDGKPLSLPMVAVMAGETDEMLVVETWFGGGCRDCNHHSVEGLKFYVGPGTEFLLKSGDYWPVEDLVPGIRLRVIGRDCGYEEVKEVQSVRLETKIPLYSMTSETLQNYGVRGPTLPNMVLVRA